MINGRPRGVAPSQELPTTPRVPGRLLDVVITLALWLVVWLALLDATHWFVTATWKCNGVMQ